METMQTINFLKGMPTKATFNGNYIMVYENTNMFAYCDVDWARHFDRVQIRLGILN
jgi:hypothetical protein